MKIRHKQSGVELEGVRDSGPDFVEGASVIQPSSIYSKEHWEAVPEWVDVTDACTVLDTHRGLQLYHGKEDVLWANGYRFRKVRFSTGIPPLSGERWAFIVERKV